MTKAQFALHKKTLLPQGGKLKKRLFPWLVIAGASLLFQIYVANMTAGEGEELAKIESQIEAVARQNQVLEEEIAGELSLSKIEHEAFELGLTKPEDIMYAENAKSFTQANVPFLGQ